MADQPFRFLDLPVELRLWVYERLSLEIKHHPIIVPQEAGSLASGVELTAIRRVFPFAILSTCRAIRNEAEELVRLRGRDLVLNAPPRIIATLFPDNQMMNLDHLYLFMKVITIQADWVSQGGMYAGIGPQTIKASTYLNQNKIFPPQRGPDKGDVSLSAAPPLRSHADSMLKWINQAAIQLRVNTRLVQVVFVQRVTGSGRPCPHFPIGIVTHLAGIRRSDGSDGYFACAGFLTAEGWFWEHGSCRVPEQYLGLPQTSTMTCLAQMDERTWTDEWLETACGREHSINAYTGTATLPQALEYH
ncbi:hypothetical protein K458DRAFT_430114 [Lentithecium fluviatile CBS 122367]|uniref:Uncharacterized protein n=1 Tax=Lentithecium fluviatile CBS 122367 TaxID=1168545 RepID=A0A6G1J6W5_9PLEO|nr:hypothetical protein K458DRAFT_430114 [Lentithecium fluviatile CBS 122367]